MTLTFRSRDVICHCDHSIPHRPYPICFFRQFFDKTRRLVTIHTLQTTDGRNTAAQVRLAKIWGKKLQQIMFVNRITKRLHTN